MGEDCGRPYRMPVSVELLWIFTMLVLLFLLLLLATKRCLKRVDQIKEAKRNTPNSKDSFMLGLRIPFGFQKSEFVDICYVCFILFCFTLHMLRILIRSIPGVEHSMVSNQNSDNPDFSTLKQWCRVDRCLLFGIPTLMIWSGFRLFFSRLFSTFSHVATLRFQKRTERITYHSMDVSALMLLIWILVSANRLVCVIEWKPVDLEGHSYYLCSSKSRGTTITLAIGMPLFIIISNLVTMIIFVYNFSRLLRMDQQARRGSVGSGNHRLMRITSVMVKLTTLSLTPSIVMFWLMVVTVATLRLGSLSEAPFYVFLYCETVCLLLVFQWMNHEYHLLCERSFCCVYQCVHRKVANEYHSHTMSLDSPKSFSEQSDRD